MPRKRQTFIIPCFYLITAMGVPSLRAQDLQVGPRIADPAVTGLVPYVTACDGDLFSPQGIADGQCVGVSEQASNPSTPTGARTAKWVDPKAPPPPQPLAPPHLSYYNGPVLSNVRIVLVRYGSGTYLGNIAGTTTPTMATWYQQVISSIHMDWLREYDTDLSGGTNQNIGRGTFVGTFQITPAAARNGSTITEQNIRDELAAQLDASNLPAANANTLYMVHFPKGKTLTTGTLSSCVSGGFCAYHNYFTHGGKPIYYGVQPDFSPGSGCDSGCGAGTEFQNQCYAAAHEMIETVTDPQPRSGWDDHTPGNDEIGDICNQQEDTVVGPDGNSYTVQKEWSNVYGACVTAPAAGYYVNGTTGDDSNLGTPTNPFKTVRAAHNAIPSDGNTAIYVAPDSYLESPLPLVLSKPAVISNSNPGGGVVRIGG